MGSVSDMPVVRKAAEFLDTMQVPFELRALSAHRTPGEVEEYARNARSRGVKVIIAAAGMSAALPGVIAAQTTLPVIGLPIAATMMGMDALLSVAMMPPGIPVAAVGVDAALNSAVLAVRILALSDSELALRYDAYCAGLSKKVTDADAQLTAMSDFKFKVNN